MDYGSYCYIQNNSSHDEGEYNLYIAPSILKLICDRCDATILAQFPPYLSIACSCRAQTIIHDIPLFIVIIQTAGTSSVGRQYVRLNTGSLQVFTSLRVYALLNKTYFWPSIVLLLGVIPIGTNMVIESVYIVLKGPILKLFY